MRRFFLTAAVLATLSPALAPTLAVAQPASLSDGTQIRAEDVERLLDADTVAGAALRQVLASGSDAEIAQATATLRGAAEPFANYDPQALAGDWSCQMTKLGGNLAVVGYAPFKCRMSVVDGLLQFEKLTGSQRTRGQIHRDDVDQRLVYLGSAFVDGEQPKPYADFGDSVDPDTTETLPDAGLLEILGPNRARLILPKPYKESFINILTLTR